MHFWAASEGGSTLFTPMNEALNKQSQERQDLLRSLYFASNDWGIKPKPLVYPHPDTKKDTMVFHLGPHFVKGFHIDYDYETDSSAKDYTIEESIEMLKTITSMMEDKALMLKMEWKEGDFAILDNLAVAHYAHPDTQNTVEKAGLRILHRTTVEGTNLPRK